MKTIKFIFYDLFVDELSNITPGKNLVISTINPYSFLVAEKDDDFKLSLQKSDILLPDGQGIVWASKYLWAKKIKKIAGFDIFVHLLDQLNGMRGRCFFFGSLDSTLRKIEEKIGIEYPNIEIGTLSPPFKAEFNPEENEEFINIINKFSPDVLFVGMTAPKQEKWVNKNKDRINSKVIASIGAVFDFYAGNEKRAHPLLIKLGLEWLARSVQDPGRLGKRNLYAIPVFVYEILKLKFFGNESINTNSR